MLKGIRGAITVEENTVESISENTILLLEEIITRNNLKNEEMASITFTATKDLTKVYPAKVTRDMGIEDVPLMCMQEMYVQGSLEKCIRVLIMINLQEKREMKHVYLKGARKLRPDLLDK